jgi:hypothetical protein
VDSLNAAFAGEWKTPDKVPHVEFGTPALARAFANHLRDYPTRATVQSIIPEGAQGDTRTFLASVSFQWRSAFGASRTKVARIRWIIGCQSGESQCEVRRVVFLDPIP